VYNNAFKNYQDVEKATISGRETEARVLTQAAMKLQVCQKNWQDGNFEELDTALKYNQKIWSIFQGELVKDDNPLPTEIKRDLLKLAGFIDRAFLKPCHSPLPRNWTSLSKSIKTLPPDCVDPNDCWLIQYPRVAPPFSKPRPIDGVFGFFLYVLSAPGPRHHM
jgi:flagellar protein FlaF